MKRKPAGPSNAELNAAHRFYAALADTEPMMIRRTNKKRTASGEPSEHQIQAAVVKWWAYACHQYGLPEFALYAVPNGGARDPITGARMKAEGVRRGVPDLTLAAKRNYWTSLQIELKTRSGHRTPEQKAFMRHLDSQGIKTATCHSSEEAIEEIKRYLTGDHNETGNNQD